MIKRKNHTFCVNNTSELKCLSRLEQKFDTDMHALESLASK